MITQFEEDPSAKRKRKPAIMMLSMRSMTHAAEKERVAATIKANPTTRASPSETSGIAGPTRQGCHDVGIASGDIAVCRKPGQLVTRHFAIWMTDKKHVHGICTMKGFEAEGVAVGNSVDDSALSRLGEIGHFDVGGEVRFEVVRIVVKGVDVLSGCSCSGSTHLRTESVPRVSQGTRWRTLMDSELVNSKYLDLTVVLKLQVATSLSVQGGKDSPGAVGHSLLE